MKVKLLYILLLTGFAGFVAGCNKDANDIATTAVTTHLDVVNATDHNFNVYQNGTRQNLSSSVLSAGSSGYLSVNAGAQNYSFKTQIDVASPSPPSTILSTPLTLEGAGYYSLFVSEGTTASTYLVKDSLAQTAGSDTAFVRFVHAAPSAGNVYVTINDAASFSNQSFPSASDFTKLPVTTTAGTTISQVIRVYATGSSVPMAAYTIANLVSGSYYTIFVKDTKLNGSTTASIGLITTRQ